MYPLRYQNAKNHQRWWKFDKVMAKTILHSFFWDTAYNNLQRPYLLVVVSAENVLVVRLRKVAFKVQDMSFSIALLVVVMPLSLRTTASDPFCDVAATQRRRQESY